MDSVGDVVGQVILYAGGGALGAAAMFRFLGEKWIQSKFDTQLQAQRHAQALELQNLKQQIDKELSRTIKLQDQEFKVLPDAWSLLHEALGHISDVVAVFQESSGLEPDGRTALGRVYRR